MQAMQQAAHGPAKPYIMQGGTRAAAAPGQVMGDRGVLSRAQVAEFKRTGVLLLPGFIDDVQLASWRRQVWAGLAAGGSEADDRSTWPQKGGHARVAMPAPLTPTPGELPQFQVATPNSRAPHIEPLSSPSLHPSSCRGKRTWRGRFATRHPC